MSVVQHVCAIVARQLLGEGAGTLYNILKNHFSPRGDPVLKALARANERAWTALEIALDSPSLWGKLKTLVVVREEKAFAERIRTYLSGISLPHIDSSSDYRRNCLAELRRAKQQGLLGVGSFSRTDAADGLRLAVPADPVAAELTLLEGLGRDLRDANFAWLGWLVEQRPAGNSSLIAVSVQYFFRREVEENQELFQGVVLEKVDHLAKQQREALNALAETMGTNFDRITSLLEDLTGQVTATVQDTLRSEFGRFKDEILALLSVSGMGSRAVGPRDSFSLRSDKERATVERLAAVFHALPPEQRLAAPDLQIALGKILVRVGDLPAAQREIESALTRLTSDQAKAEGHLSAYRVALETHDWQAALEHMLKAATIDGRKYAPFPVGRYTPVKILGAGGFGVVYLCKHRLMGNQVVVKALLAEELDRDPDSVFNEARVLQQINHPALVKMTDCGYVSGSTKSRPYFVMEYFDGASLEEWVKQHGRLAPVDLKAVMRPVANALIAAHEKQILHRDIKPANILVRKSGDAWDARLIDFGLALKQEALATNGVADSRTITGVSIAGTVDYAAPEQLGKLAGVRLGPQSDVYAFGRSCYYALLGTPHPDDRQKRQLNTRWRNFLSDCTANTDRLANFNEVLKRFSTLPNSNLPPEEKSGGKTRGTPAPKPTAPETDRTPTPSSFQAPCPHCKYPLLLQKQHLGLTVRCPKCSGVFKTSGPGAAPPSPAVPKKQPVVGGAFAPTAPAVQVSCPKCNTVLTLPGSSTGQVLKCPKCQQGFRLNL